jgi:hypothetical protein
LYFEFIVIDIYSISIQHNGTYAQIDGAFVLDLYCRLGGIVN